MWSDQRRRVPAPGRFTGSPSTKETATCLLDFRGNLSKWHAPPCIVHSRNTLNQCISPHLHFLSASLRLGVQCLKVRRRPPTPTRIYTQRLKHAAHTLLFSPNLFFFLHF